MKIKTIENNYDVIPDLVGRVVESKELDVKVEFENGETCWVSRNAVIVISDTDLN